MEPIIENTRLSATDDADVDSNDTILAVNVVTTFLLVGSHHLTVLNDAVKALSVTPM